MTATSTEKIIIVGTGAMASLFAARLSASGIPVIMLGNWKEAINALQKDGVCLIDTQGNKQSYPIEVTSNPEDCLGLRYALVLVKSWQTSQAANLLARCLHDDGIALTLQNGLGNRELLIEKLGGARVALGTTTMGASLVKPGVVRQAGEGVVTIGAHPHIQPLSRILRKCNFIIENASDLQSLLWGKLIINAAINPTTALLEIRNGELLNNAYAHEVLKAAAREAASVAMAQGIQLPYADPVSATETIARRTAENRSSMLQDIQRGAPTEIDAITGAIVETGNLYGIVTPVNQILWKLVKAKIENLQKGKR